MIILIIILIILFNKNSKIHLISEYPVLQVLRGALLLITTCFMFTGLSYLPFAENIAIYMIGPVITTILAFFIIISIYSSFQFFGTFLGGLIGG